MKRLSGEEVIKLAMAQGISITYKKRVEGGYRIKSINGVRYDPTLSTGMNALRTQLSAPLSRAQKKQRRVANPTFALTKTEIKAFKKLNRVSRLKRQRAKKLGVELKNPKIYEPIKPSQAKRSKKFYKNDYIKTLKNAMWHKSGLAYRANVEWFGMQIAKIYGDSDPLVKALIAGKIVMTDDDLVDLHSILYSETIPSFEKLKAQILDARKSAKKLIKELNSI